MAEDPAVRLWDTTTLTVSIGLHFSFLSFLLSDITETAFEEVPGKSFAVSLGAEPLETQPGPLAQRLTMADEAFWKLNEPGGKITPTSLAA